VRDGSEFEQLAGYARAVRVGRHVAVSGTAALSEGVVLFPGDAYRQTREAIAKALTAAEQLGASAADVIRTRLLLAAGCDWPRRFALGEAFAGVDPANTTYFVAVHSEGAGRGRATRSSTARRAAAQGPACRRRSNSPRTSRTRRGPGRPGVIRATTGAIMKPCPLNPHAT
jgi:enamine deaminase RidA (YjgF/YER057c/UK114 family)